MKSIFGKVENTVTEAKGREPFLGGRDIYWSNAAKKFTKIRTENCLL